MFLRGDIVNWSKDAYVRLESSLLSKKGFSYLVVRIMGDSPSIFRIFIPVTDFDSALNFYQQLLNQSGRTIHRGRHYFDCGPVILAVIENNGTPIGDHVYFSVADLDAIFERASELGCLERSDVHGSPSDEISERPWGERSFYARDPFGNGLCFVDENTLFTGI